MLTFFVGMMIGGVVGFMTFALLAVGSDADDWDDENQITMNNEKEDK